MPRRVEVGCSSDSLLDCHQPMVRIGSPQDLASLRQDLLTRSAFDATVRVCSTGCRALGALDVCEALEQEIAHRSLAGRVRVVRAGCHGLCAGAVALVIDPAGIFYQGVTPEDAREIIQTTVMGGQVIERLCFSSRSTPIHRKDE